MSFSLCPADFAFEGASFPVVLSAEVTQPVILLTTVAPGSSEVRRHLSAMSA